MRSLLSQLVGQGFEPGTWGGLGGTADRSNKDLSPSLCRRGGWESDQRQQINGDGEGAELTVGLGVVGKG